MNDFTHSLTLSGWFFHNLLRVFAYMRIANILRSMVNIAIDTIHYNIHIHHNRCMHVRTLWIMCTPKEIIYQKIMIFLAASTRRNKCENGKKFKSIQLSTNFSKICTFPRQLFMCNFYLAKSKHILVNYVDLSLIYNCTFRPHSWLQIQSYL